MPDLETVDITGVEILAAGGPVFGVGSPPEGDFWTEDDLRAMAAANQELADELKPPNKIGHSDGQQLLLNSGLGQPTDGEMPAVGWLDGTTFRVEPAAGGEPAKLLADLKAVPKTFAELVKSGAWRTRSVELSKVTSQKTEKVYDWVVTGLAWLGAKLPAVRTLDDVVALYAGNGVELKRVFAKGDVVWSPTDGYESLRYRVDQALNGPETGGMNESRFWVRDVAADRALVEDWYDSGGPQTAWIVPFTIGADGDITVADRDIWTKAEVAWLEAAKEYAHSSSRLSRRRVDSRPMPELQINEEQTAQLAETLGVEGELTAEKLLEAAKAKAEDKPEQRSLADEAIVKLQTSVEEEKEARRKFEEDLRIERRANFIDNEAIKTGKIEPGQREYLETLYDADPDKARKYVETLPVREDLLREFGSDGDDQPTSEEEREEADRSYEDEYERIYGERPMQFGRRS